MKLNDVNKSHFIGIGGIGMSALARLFLHEGKEVTGSDQATSPVTCGLEALGIAVIHEQKAENITDDIDLVVYTEAMDQKHPEMVAAREKGITMVNYFTALGMAMNSYHLIAVAGTHGKTTTTAMLTDIFEDAEYDPTAIVGSLRNKTDSNFRSGKSTYGIVEACEYRRDFLHLEPDVLVITNIEAEHLDYYNDLADVQDAFRKLAEKVPEGGAIICNPKNPNVAPVIEGLSIEIIDYTKHFDPMRTLKQPGVHNQMNAAAAAAAAVHEGISNDAIKQSLEQFAGVWRRFEYKGELNGAAVYDDYGHHPTEITATVTAAKEHFSGKRIVLVFQPHLASRTAKLFDRFVDALALADTVILAPIYKARTESSATVTSKEIILALTENGVAAEYIETFDAIVEKLRSEVTENDVVLVMGAGDITDVANTLVE